MKNILLKKLKNLKGKKIAVIGDIILDKYVYGDVDRISPEAPVPVVKVKSTDLKLGAAANVAKNIISLGGTPILIGLIGEDSNGKIIRDLLLKEGIEPYFLIIKQDFISILKERVIGLNQQVVRIDYDPPENNFRIVNQVMERLEKTEPDAVIIEDYNKGLIYTAMISKVTKWCKDKGIFTVADPHPTRSCTFYRGVDAITPNSNEAKALLHLKNTPSPEEMTRMISSKCGTDITLITRGAQGMLLFHRGKYHFIPTRARKVYDVTGAGDTVVALFTMANVSGFSPLQAAQLANYGASYVVTVMGTASVNEMILKEMINGR
ncbi:D-glycero-beta-D-manno-heptose-7-phosphate kinase [bacterium]|nr:D-glycero-beta-D-manno-heptose-7-phosphate kinase [bacterium]